MYTCVCVCVCLVAYQTRESPLEFVLCAQSAVHLKPASAFWMHTTAGVMQAARQQAVKYYELAGSQTISSIPFLPSHTWHPASTPPAPHNPHRNHQTSSCAIGLDVDKAGDFCYDRLASSAPANIGLTGALHLSDSPVLFS